MTRSVADEFAPPWIRELPLVTTADAAWLAGMTAEAMEQLLGAAHLKAVVDSQGTRKMALSEIFRAGFGQLGQKESQVTMLRMQLAKALEREQELAGLLSGKLSFDPVAHSVPSSSKVFPVPTPSAASTERHPAVMAVVKDRKGKKR